MKAGQKYSQYQRQGSRQPRTSRQAEPVRQARQVSRHTERRSRNSELVKDYL